MVRYVGDRVAAVAAETPEEGDMGCKPNCPLNNRWGLPQFVWRAGDELEEKSAGVWCGAIRIGLRRHRPGSLKNRRRAKGAPSRFKALAMDPSS